MFQRFSSPGPRCGRTLRRLPPDGVRYAFAENGATDTPDQFCHIDRLRPYARNPRKNDAAVDCMCTGVREFGFKIPVLARRNGEVCDGHLRLKAARKLELWPGGDITQIPVSPPDERSEALVRAFRLLVNRSQSGQTLTKNCSRWNSRSSTKCAWRNGRRQGRRRT